MPSITGVFKEGIDLVKDNYLSALGTYIVFFVFGIVLTVIVLALAAGMAGGIATGITGGGLSASNLGTEVTTLFVPIIMIVLIPIIAIILISPIFSGIYYSLAMQAMGKKGKASLGKAFGESIEAYKKLLWTLILTAIITFVIVVIIFVPFTIYLIASGSSAALHNNVLAVIVVVGITAIVGVIVLLALSILFYEAVPLAMLDGTSGLAAIEKSVAIGRKYYRSIIGLIILTALFSGLVYIVAGIISVIFSIISPIVGIIANFVISIILDSFLVALSGFLPIVFYKRYVNA